jgi:glycosyltransferase involved in cell wall biosynthesis
LSSNNKKILFLVFSPLFTKGGQSKNFMNVIKHIEPEIQKNNITADIISFNNTSSEKTENINKISKTTFLNSYKIKIHKRFFPSGKVLFQIAELTLNFIRTTLYIIVNRPDIVYAYTEKALYFAAPIKKLFKFRLVYDMRGDVIDELKVRGAAKRYISILSKLYTISLNAVDLVFSVSSTFNISSKSKFVPKFNYYDGEIFKYDESSMIKKKKELKLEDKFVFVYTGNAHYYQFLDGTIDFFSQFQKKYNDSFLIIITEFDFDKFSKLLDKYSVPKSSYMLRSLPQHEISELQQVADMGFLLRENLPLNHHSFPTKFAEYLASGVPVLMTPYIYSIAPMVAENDLGEVIEIKDDYSDEIEKIYLKYKNNPELKNHCSQYAGKELMWQKKSIDIFNDIINA